MKRYHIVEGDLTTMGGIVQRHIGNGKGFTWHGKIASHIGDKVNCPACGAVGIIQASGSRLSFNNHGLSPALHGDLCICKCSPPPLLKHSQEVMYQEVSSGGGANNFTSSSYFYDQSLMESTHLSKIKMVPNKFLQCAGILGRIERIDTQEFNENTILSMDNIEYWVAPNKKIYFIPNDNLKVYNFLLIDNEQLKLSETISIAKNLDEYIESLTIQFQNLNEIIEQCEIAFGKNNHIADVAMMNGLNRYSEVLGYIEKLGLTPQEQKKFLDAAEKFKINS